MKKELNEDGELCLMDGEYGIGRDGKWYYRIPGGHIGNLGNHTVEEHDDGTISVTPSILIEYGDGRKFHGYVKHGMWKSC